MAFVGSSPFDDPERRRKAVLQVEESPTFIGFYLRRYAQMQGLTDQELAGELGTDEGGLHNVGLAHTPVFNQSFTIEVRNLAQRLQCSAPKLEEIIVSVVDAGAA